MAEMRLETSKTGSLRLGLAALAALAFSIGLASGNLSPARAQIPGVYSVGPDQPLNQNGATDPDQQAHDAADAAQEALDSAIDARNQLESDGAPQDQIDAANQAVAQARADKEAADEAAQNADEKAAEGQGN